MALALYDLDNTLLAGDSEHAWCEFLVDLELVDNPVAVNPDPVLRAHAEAAEWPVIRLHET